MFTEAILFLYEINDIKVFRNLDFETSIDLRAHGKCTCCTQIAFEMSKFVHVVKLLFNR